jgi:hypothetical protein
MATFSAGIYDSYQEGEINNTDLVDLTWHLENFSPSDNYQARALSSLSSLGYDAPTNLSTVGHMTVIDLEQNTEHQGILMSQEVPENNTFEGRNDLQRQRTGWRSVRRYDQLEARTHR